MNSVLKSGVVVMTLFSIIFLYTFLKTTNIKEQMKLKLLTQIAVSNSSTSTTEKLETVTVPSEKVFNILIWTDDTTVPFVYLKKGRTIFIEENCQYTNCYITKDQKYLPLIDDFDALIFHAPEFTYRPWKRFQKPPSRSPKQLYVFTCIESAQNYPVCDSSYNNFFNWTWTYRTTSEVKWGYVDIKDTEGNIIGPKENMPWITNMNDTSEEVLSIIANKTKAVAWIVSNCYTKSGREIYAKELEKSLKAYNLNIDIYGKCGELTCEDTEECHQFIKNDYYFYLSFENSFAEDYVTEKFIHAVKNYAIPIVWGGADYDRFAPPNSYINAKEMKAPDLAKLIVNLMKNKTEYASYFKWRNHYHYQRDIETPDTRASCRMCQALNERYSMETANKAYEDFQSWWNAGIPNKCSNKGF